MNKEWHKPLRIIELRDKNKSKRKEKFPGSEIDGAVLMKVYLYIRGDYMSNNNNNKRNGQILPMPLGDPHLSVDYEGSFIAPFVILDTDYENFSCIYSCTEYNFGYYSDFSFIFSRSPSLSEKYLRRCEAAFKNIGVDVSRFAKTVQGSNCPYDTQESL
ncbi:crustacyanin-C1 subunit-like [Penaeus japonicus]|uniref:crustacyanin-C1 subunit-like n=1 Tax=Penaeus japonicus TaxID=27405 RepID=UPI001C712F30|nr:crustacyanin-C1 subunit-like [Penaeus japonicus]